MIATIATIAVATIIWKPLLRSLRSYGNQALLCESKKREHLNQSVHAFLIRTVNHNESRHLRPRRQHFNSGLFHSALSMSGVIYYQIL